ncbi:MAG: M20/M25/M40 family metallo-hydrolase, partial [Chloroflexota bacterium]
MTDYKKVDAYLDANLDASLNELGKFVAQPSISAQKLGLHECAAMVADMLKKRGFTAAIHQTAGAPIVTAERKGKSDKTILFYNHYDVQPPEPLELWESPPFEPQIRDGKMYGRGISDDKGHLVARLFALDALLAEGKLP